MSKKLKRPNTSTIAPEPKVKNPASRRKYLLAGFALLFLAGAAYYFFGTPPKSKALDFKADSDSETTLTAKNPRLQLLSPAEGWCPRCSKGG